MKTLYLLNIKLLYINTRYYYFYIRERLKFNYKKTTFSLGIYETA